MGILPMNFHCITYLMFERHANKIFSEAQILLQCRRFYSKRTHYDVLNVKKECSNDEIRQSFAKLSKKYHPDTSQAGSAEQNSRKFQQIMEAYKVLGRKSSRAAYDAEMSASPSANPYYNPYYATSNQRERRFYEGDFASWQQQMNNNRNEYYRNRPPYENSKWDPAVVFNGRRVYGFILAFVFMNFLSVFLVYNLSARNRVYRDFGDPKILYERHGHGITSRRYQIDIPDEVTSNPPT